MYIPVINYSVQQSHEIRPRSLVDEITSGAKKTEMKRYKIGIKQS